MTSCPVPTERECQLSESANVIGPFGTLASNPKSLTRLELRLGMEREYQSANI